MMHGQKNIKLCNAEQAKRVYQYKQSALHLHTVRQLTEGDDTRGCGDKIGPPDDEQRAA